jgi:glycine cleavage system H lipoate-binding protein
MAKKRGFVDRTQVLSDSNKAPNVMINAKAVECNNNNVGYSICKFKCKVSVVEEPDVLDAMVMANEICVLVLKEPQNCLKIEFKIHLNSDEISGKLKKKAKLLKAGDIVCTVTTTDNVKHEYKTPVGGQLLEFNESLLASHELLFTDHQNLGYIAIIYPNTLIPGLDGYIDYNSLMEQMNKNKRIATENVCYSFLQGNCNRGSNCKFKHEKI